MHLRLVSAPAAAAPADPAPRHSMVAPRPRPEDYPFAETPLVVAFAASDDLSLVRAGARVALASMPDISGDDAYLVLPLRARESLVAAFARGAEGRVAQWFDEAVVVRAELDGGRAPRLWVGEAWRARDLLESLEGAPVAMDAVGDPLRALNALPHAASVAPGGLFDRRGITAVTAQPRYVGVGRVGIEELGLGADAVEPTWVWTVRDEGRTRVRVALCASEDDSVVALLCPLTLVG